MTEIDFTDPWSLLVRFKPYDTEQIYHVYQPDIKKLAELEKLVNETPNGIIPIQINAKVFGQILQIMNDPFCGVIQKCSPQEQIDLVIGLHKLGIGTDSGFFDLGPITDQICEGYIDKGIEFKRFQDTSKKYGLDMYEPVGLVKTLKVMLPTLNDIDNT